MEQINMLEVLRRINRLYGAMQKPVCQRCGLAPLEATILGFLHNNPTKDTAAEIAECRLLAKGNVSIAVESLIQKGLLRRRQDREDRRKIHLSLTPQAAPAVQAIDRLDQRFWQRLFRGFSQEELAQCVCFQKRLAANTVAALTEQHDL